MHIKLQTSSSFKKPGEIIILCTRKREFSDYLVKHFLPKLFQSSLYLPILTKDVKTRHNKIFNFIFWYVLSDLTKNLKILYSNFQLLIPNSLRDLRDLSMVTSTAQNHVTVKSFQLIKTYKTKPLSLNNRAAEPLKHPLHLTKMQKCLA